MFHYFGYGSNINLLSLKAKGVIPLHSEIGLLKGWKLKFNVEHWFRHEGGMGNIVPGDTETDWVEGVVHQCKDEDLEKLDLMEAYGVGYDRTLVSVQTSEDMKQAIAYTGLPAYINDQCLPTKRYMSIILKGAKEAGLSSTYLKKLEEQELLKMRTYPKYVAPEANELNFTQNELENQKHLTALCGYVFSMKNARKKLHCLFDLFGGKDMTLFHIKRHHESKGKESIEDYLRAKLPRSVNDYLNAYLHEYEREFEYVGRYHYDLLTSNKF